METTEPRTRRCASKEGPDPIDVHVGQRIRLRRTMLGQSQEQLARALGVSFQQVQKYERGTNRISASRLFDVSRVLAVPVGFFFEDLGADDLIDRDIEVGRPELPAPIHTPTSVSGDDMAVLTSWHRLRPDQQGAFLTVIEAASRTAPLTQAAE